MTPSTIDSGKPQITIIIKACNLVAIVFDNGVQDAGLLNTSRWL